VTVGTTVDDLIDLKDNAVAVSYRAVEAVLAVFGETAEGAMGDLLAEARDVRDRAELYDAADESDAVSIEDYEENYAPPCPHRHTTRVDDDNRTCDDCGAAIRVSVTVTVTKEAT
jgi:hypothetical protein